MKDELTILHEKIRELGGNPVRKLLGNPHGNKFGSFASGIVSLTPEIKEKIKSAWPEEFKSKTEDEVETIPGNIGVNQLNLVMLSPVRNSYDPATVNTIVGLVRRTGCGWIQRPFDSMIARSRNILAKAFLKSDFEWSFWIDDDMIIPNGDPAWFMQSCQIPQSYNVESAGCITPYQLASWNKTLVSGVYYSRHGGSPNQITAGFNPGTMFKNRFPHKSITPIRYCGFGCVIVHRKVFEDILTKHPELNMETSTESGFFTPFNTGDRMAGEDEAFCLRAHEAGHTTFLDTSVIAGHVGRKIAFIPQNG